ncbi:MAG: PIN domain-containing protein [Pirellulales bacterium]|nr:PIN domain-containing protein [Pirellulales bacterium]
MNPVFLDSSGLIAVIVTDDQWHSQAESVWEKLIAEKTSLMTTDLILLEIGDTLSRFHQRSLAVEIYDQLSKYQNVEIIPPTPKLIATGWQLYRNRPDKEWSVTDCISFSIMSQRSIQDAFAIDHHFEQAGFKKLIQVK